MTDINAFNKTIVDEFRANGGKVGGPFAGRPMVLVTHTGAKSGAARTTPLVYSLDGGDVIIVASMGGAPSHPAWYRNMATNPAVTVEVGDESYPATVVELHGDERQRAWDAHCAEMPIFNDYQTRTERLIPVLRLVRS